MKKFTTILHGKIVSLSLIDWFITVYAKREKIIIKNTTSNKYVNDLIVHDEYKTALKSAQKRYFDIFCRYDGIEYRYTEPYVVEYLEQLPISNSAKKNIKAYYGQSSIKTAICQMNICMWIIENNILEYITDNLTTLKLEMRNQKKTRTRIGKVTQLNVRNNVGKSLQDAIDVLNKNL